MVWVVGLRKRGRLPTLSERR
jgi:hypothetical protein